MFIFAVLLSFFLFGCISEQERLFARDGIGKINLLNQQIAQEDKIALLSELQVILDNSSRMFVRRVYNWEAKHIYGQIEITDITKNFAEFTIKIASKLAEFDDYCISFKAKKEGAVWKVI